MLIFQRSTLLNARRPIVFAGIGQGYDDLKQFDPDWLLEQLFE